MREVEIKAYVRDVEVTKAKIEAVCGNGQIVNKFDFYFRVPGQKESAFRLRNNNGRLECTAKKKSSGVNGENNLEYEFSTSLDQLKSATAFFSCLGYEEYYRKTKEGWEWGYDNAHIELLSVNELGYFLEIEELIPFASSDGDVADTQFHIQKLLSKFGVSKDDICTKSYKSMILGD